MITATVDHLHTWKSIGLGLALVLLGVFALVLCPVSQAQAVQSPTRYEQTDPNIVKTGTWGDFSKAEASDGSYGRSASVGASVTVYFNGTRCDWIGMTGITPGIVDVYLDGVKKATLDLYSSTARYQVLHWSSGELPAGDHVVRLVRSDKSSTGEYLVLDAFDIWGTIGSTPAPILSSRDRVKASWLAGYLSGLGSRLAPYAAYICDEAYNYRVPLPLALSFFKDENYWWKESYCIAHPRSWLNKNIGNLGFRTWQVERYPGTVLESGYTYNRFAAFPTVECGIDAWFYSMRVRSSTYAAGVDMIWAGDVEGGLAKILYTYAPPTENDTAARVASALSYYNTIAARMEAEGAFEPGPGTPTIPPPPPVPPVSPPPPPPAAPTRFEQTDGKIAYSGTWLNFIASGSSGGTYKYADSTASVTITFDGTRLDWIATKGYTQGKAVVRLDGGSPVVVDLYNATTQRQVKVWTTGTIAAGTHKLTITWTGQRSVSTGGTRINIDAVDVVGALK